MRKTKTLNNTVGDVLNCQCIQNKQIVLAPPHSLHSASIRSRMTPFADSPCLVASMLQVDFILFQTLVGHTAFTKLQ